MLKAVNAEGRMRNAVLVALFVVGLIMLTNAAGQEAASV